MDPVILKAFQKQEVWERIWRKEGAEEKEEEDRRRGVGRERRISPCQEILSTCLLPVLVRGVGD